MAHVLLAMSYAKLNQPEEARSEFALGRAPIEQKLPNGLEKIPDVGWLAVGVWHDWVVGELLLREADGLIK
jgi:hypothetical protein